MIQKITPNFTKIVLLFSLVVLTKLNSYAQTPVIGPQQLPFERICAGFIVNGVVFNEYFATFSYVDFPAGTTFAVELSDETGSFTNPTATTTLAVTDDTALKQQTIKFAVPTNLKGSDAYSLRVKSLNTTPVVNSPRFKNAVGNTTFSVYYSTYVSSFYINEKQPTASFCAGGNLTLSVYNPTPSDQASSPANYSNLKYKWYKDGAVIAGQSSKDLIVNSAGKYYAEIDYGLCSDVNFSSNRVDVTTSGSGGSAVTISSSLGNPFCASGSGTVLTATSGNTYVWKKDGAIISGATTRSINANASGVYTVQVDFGGCSATGTIDLKSNSFNASIDAPETTSLNEGETLNVSVTTDASNPTFEWFLNGNAIASATSSSYVVSVPGNYKVKISQASGCISSQEFSFKVTGPMASTTVIPNVVSLQNPYWNIPDVYKTVQTKIIIMSSNGEIMYDGLGSDYNPETNTFIKDFKNVNPVYYYVIKSDNGEKKGSITVIR